MNITFVDTGLHTSIGERLRAVRHLLRDNEMFLANYGDTLTDANLHGQIAAAKDAEVTASFLVARPNYSFHLVSMDDRGIVNGIHDVKRSDVWLNGGYFVLRREVLEQMRPGEDLVDEPFNRLAASGQLLAQRHEGFWAPMDTLKDKQWLESLHESGAAPWQVWDADRLLDRDRVVSASG